MPHGEFANNELTTSHHERLLGVDDSVLSLAEFRTLLGPSGERLTPEELLHAYGVLHALADLLFDVWVEEKSKRKK